jgi:hypothetical protein
VIGPAGLDQALDDIFLLVHLDRKDTAVGALIAVLGDGAQKGLVELDDPRLEDLGEADEHRRADAALADLVHEVLHVD